MSHSRASYHARLTVPPVENVVDNKCASRHDTSEQSNQALESESRRTAFAVRNGLAGSPLMNSDFHFVPVSPSPSAPRAAFPHINDAPTVPHDGAECARENSAPPSGYDRRKDARTHLQARASFEHELFRLSEILRNPSATPHEVWVAQMQLNNLRALEDAL